MKERIARLFELLKALPPKRLLTIAGFLIVAAAIPFTVAVQQLQQNLQQEAATPDSKGSVAAWCPSGRPTQAPTDKYSCPSWWCVGYSYFGGQPSCSSGADKVLSGGNYCYYPNVREPNSPKCGYSASPTSCASLSLGGKCVSSCSTGSTVVDSAKSCPTGGTCCKPLGNAPCGDFGGKCVADANCKPGNGIAGGQCSGGLACCDASAVVATPQSTSTSAPKSQPQTSTAPSAKICNPTEERCSGNFAQSCNSTGTAWSNPGADCKTNKCQKDFSDFPTNKNVSCLAPCTPKAERCVTLGGVLRPQTCASSGIWASPGTCTTGTTCKSVAPVNGIAKVSCLASGSGGTGPTPTPGQGGGTETCLATPGQTCETGIGNACPIGKMNLGASGTCSTGKVCCRPPNNAPDLSALPGICTEPPHPYWSCPTTSAKDIERFWSKYADVLIPGTCRPKKFGQDGCISSSPESSLPPNVYAGTVLAGTITKTQMASLKYNNTTTSKFTSALPTCKISATLSNMWNHCQSGGYAGNKADFEAAMKTVEDIYVARMIIDSNNNLTRDQIIKSMTWYTGPTGCKASINPTGIEPLGDYATTCSLVPDGAPEPTDHLCKLDSQCPTGMKCTVATGQCSYLGGSNPPPPTGGNGGDGGTCGGKICNGVCIPLINQCIGGSPTPGPTAQPSPTPPGGTCNAPKTQCDNVCTNMQSDNNNCGSCDTHCSSGQTCQNGSCQGGTSTGETKLTLDLGLDGIGVAGDKRNPTGGGNTNPKTLPRSLTVEVYDSSNNIIDTRNENLTYNTSTKRFTATVALKQSFTTGNYIVKVKSPRYLRKQVGGISIITAGQTKSMPQVNLTAGDIVTNNKIDIADYGVWLSCSVYSKDEGACKSNADYKKLSDLTDDGPVDEDDYQLLLREWEVQDGD